MPLFRRRSGRAVPKLALVTDPAVFDPELRAARDAAVGSGRWQPVADLLTATGTDWDRRAFRIQVLAETTGRSRHWVEKWRAEEPDDPDALVVGFSTEIFRAAEARGGAWAKDVPYDAFARMYEILDGLPALGERAAEAAPDDPTPWVSMLWLAVLGDHDRPWFDRVWTELGKRGPGLRQAYIPALQYLSDKWHGSHEEMFAFARSAAKGAPAGSPLAVLPLQAHLEYGLRETESVAKPAEWLAEYWGSDETAADIDAALAAQAEAAAEAAEERVEPTATGATADAEDEDDADAESDDTDADGTADETDAEDTEDAGRPLDMHDRSVLTAALCLAERWPEARAQFEAMEHRVYEYPWRYLPSPYLADSHRTAMTTED